MSRLNRILQMIYALLSTSPAIKAKSIGQTGNTILLMAGKNLYEITIKQIEERN